METNSHPEAAASNVKQGQYSPRKRKDTTPRVNPQLAVELVYQELKRVEVYTKRIEDATARKVQIDGKSLESAENRLKNVLQSSKKYSHDDREREKHITWCGGIGVRPRQRDKRAGSSHRDSPA
ncbi:hypothetical protein [Bacteroides xylanisolvens]|uniref:hypothetical protein n=1 Tax=Bacteroides xylanisolvens TaxID=371601 RepID=UPI00293B94CA|nr:hypothetical protein [Bacteroides xylanisolvens]